MEQLNETGFRAVHPGEILLEEIKERKIKQKDLAAAIGMSVSHFNELIKGKRNITTEIALKLEQVLHIDAIFWLNLQKQYEYDVLVLKHRQVEEQQASETLNNYNEYIDIKTMLKVLDIFFVNNQKTLKELETRYQLPAIETLQSSMGLFRKSEKVNADIRMVRTWEIIAHYFASQKIINSEYNETLFPEMIEEVKNILNENKNTIQRLEETFAKYGIAFVVVEKVDKAPIDAYCFWQKGHPNIAVTLRYKNIDNLAFSLMHELGHLYYKDNTTIEMLFDDKSSIEKRANDFAANSLINNDVWKKAPKCKINPASIQKEYTKWAAEIGINKWIALGRIGFETGMYKFRKDKARVIS